MLRIASCNVVFLYLFIHTTFRTVFNIDGTIDVLNRRLLQPVEWSIAWERIPEKGDRWL